MLDLPEKKPINDGWLGYFEAYSEEVKVLIGEEVEASFAPLHESSHIKTTLIAIGDGFKVKKGNGDIFMPFIRPIKEKPLKPINENCLFKPILVWHKDEVCEEEAKKHILIGVDGDQYLVGKKLRFPSVGFQSFGSWSNAKRCPDITYGDE